MSLNNTTLSGAIAAGDVYLTLASGTGAAVGKFLKVDDEFMAIQSIDNSPTLKVARGQNGTLAVDHATGATVAMGLGSDFPPIPAARQYTYGAAGAIAVAPGVHILQTGAGSAMTLADPTGDQDGIELAFQAADAHAYTVTNTTGFNGGGTGSDVATFGGAKGDSFAVRAVNRQWLVTSLHNVTLG